MKSCYRGASKARKCHFGAQEDKAFWRIFAARLVFSSQIQTTCARKTLIVRRKHWRHILGLLAERASNGLAHRLAYRLLVIV